MRSIPTPDLARIELRFDAADPAMRRRAAYGSRVLVSGALTVGTTIAPFVSGRAMRRLERIWARAVTGAARLSLDTDGIANVDPTSQYIVMPLHESFVDIPVLLHLPLPLRFTVRDELLSLPRIGPYLTATGQIPIPEEPGRSDLRAIQAAVADAVDSGESIVVFPQGSILGVETAFASGARWLARATGLDVLPVVIAGTHMVWEYPFSTTMRFDRSVTLRALEPIPAGDLSRDRMRVVERAMKQAAIDAPHPVRHFDPLRDGWWDGYRFDIDPDFPDLHRALTARRAADPTPPQG